MGWHVWLAGMRTPSGVLRRDCKDSRMTGWGAEWYSKNLLDGETRHVIWEATGGGPSGPVAQPVIFRTRDEARQYVKDRYGYIRTRQDLRREPHGWRVPRVVRIEVTARVIS